MRTLFRFTPETFPHRFHREFNYSAAKSIADSAGPPTFYLEINANLELNPYWKITY